MKISAWISRDQSEKVIKWGFLKVAEIFVKTMKFEEVRPRNEDFESI